MENDTTSRAPYERTIVEAFDVLGHPRGDHDPRHVEAIIRLAYPTLDGIHVAEFRTEVSLALACLRTMTKDAAEELAQSFGL